MNYVCKTVGSWYKAIVVFAMNKTRFVMRANPKIQVEVLDRVERRLGAKLKWGAVLYKASDERLTVRDEAEFLALFQPVPS